MAEPVGTTLSVVSLATALSGTVISVVECIEYAQLSRSFGKDFDKSQVRLCALKLQVTRWGVCAGVLTDPKTGQRRIVEVNQQTASAASKLWSTIEYDLNEVEQRSKSYVQRQLSPSPEDLEVFETREMADWTRALSSQVDTIAADRMGDVSLARKVKWAFYEQKKFSRLLDDIAGNFSDLKQLLPQLAEPQQQLCRLEVEEVQNSQSQEAIQMLHETSRANQDTILEQALKQVLLNRGSSHRWELTEVEDNVELRQGDQIASDFRGRALVGRIGHDYGTTIGKGQARISQGDIYGNK